MDYEILSLRTTTFEFWKKPCKTIIFVYSIFFIINLIENEDMVVIEESPNSIVFNNLVTFCNYFGRTL